MCHRVLDQIKHYSLNWKRLNPEYEIRLYDDQLCREFLRKKYSPLHAEIFDFIRDGPIKCDFWRVCVLNHSGGLYVDADIEPLVPLREYIDATDDFVTCISHYYKQERLERQLNPHFILCRQGNRILESAIQKYIQLYRSGTPYAYWSWSICELMVIPGIPGKASQTIEIEGMMVKLLLEAPSLQSCSYNGVTVLNNRYPTYVDHDFVTAEQLGEANPSAESQRTGGVPPPRRVTRREMNPLARWRRTNPRGREPGMNILDRAPQPISQSSIGGADARGVAQWVLLVPTPCVKTTIARHVLPLKPVSATEL